MWQSLKNFYASFFTDSSLTKLKNSEFEKLSQLKEALDKIGESNDGYQAAKAKYDALKKAIKPSRISTANLINQPLSMGNWIQQRQ